MTAILIVSYADDPCYQKVARRLSERGVRHALLDTSDFPRRAGLSLSLAMGRTPGGTLHLPDGDLPLDEIAAVYFRKHMAPIPADSLTDPEARRYVRAETNELLADLWAQLDVTWLPARPHAIELAQLKLRQLRLALALGFEIPDSLVTSKREPLLAMYEQHRGQIISKLVGPTAFQRVHGKSLIRYTERISRADLAFSPSVALCPVLFQAYVDKLFEVRVTVVGSDVFAAEIHSQSTNHTHTDWRQYDRNRPRYLAHRLPDDLAERCVTLARRLGLAYAAIDLIFTKDRRYVFLEANPAGEYNWLEEYAELPISNAIADLLIAGARQ